MNQILEKITYLKVLTEELDKNTDTKEGQIYSAFMSAMDELSNALYGIDNTSAIFSQEYDTFNNYSHQIDRELFRHDDEIYGEFDFSLQHGENVMVQFYDEDEF